MRDRAMALGNAVRDNVELHFMEILSILTRYLSLCIPPKYNGGDAPTRYVITARRVGRDAFNPASCARFKREEDDDGNDWPPSPTSQFVASSYPHMTLGLHWEKNSRSDRELTNGYWCIRLLFLDWMDLFLSVCRFYIDVLYIDRYVKEREILQKFCSNFTRWRAKLHCAYICYIEREIYERNDQNAKIWQYTWKNTYCIKVNIARFKRILRVYMSVNI